MSERILSEGLDDGVPLLSVRFLAEGGSIPFRYRSSDEDPRVDKRPSRTSDGPDRDVMDERFHAWHDLESKLLSWDDSPHVIRVVANDTAAARLVCEASAAEGRVLTLDISGIADRAALAARLAELFQYPHHAVGFDAAIDLMSDLEWMPSASGYLFCVTGLDLVPPEVSGTVSSLVPPVIDRWRTQRVPFVAVLVSSSSRSSVLAALRESNRLLDEIGSKEWNVVEIGRVPVLVDGRPDIDQGNGGE